MTWNQQPTLETLQQVAEAHSQASDQCLRLAMIAATPEEKTKLLIDAEHWANEADAAASEVRLLQEKASLREKGVPIK